MGSTQATASSAGDVILQFIPLTIISLIYAAIVFAVARKRGVNPWLWAIGTALPLVGLIIIGPLFMLLSFLSVFDRLKVLEEQGSF